MIKDNHSHSGLGGDGIRIKSENIENMGKFNKIAFFSKEYDNRNSGTAKTINWNSGNKQKIIMTGNCTFTFINPKGACHVQLRAIQDATGSRTHTWTGGGLSIKWANSTEPTWNTGANTVNIVNLYFDGDSWWGMGSVFLA